jgi:Leucine-rich repeat (LRR) protein
MLSKLVVLSLHRSIRNGPGIKGPLLSFDHLSNIQELYLGGNDISGAIPNDFLNSAPGDMELFVELSDNVITGTLPSSLAKFESLSLLLTGNKISGIHKDICSKKSWMRGDVANFGCDAILCPPGAYSELGRQSSTDTACESCQSNTFAPYYGSTACYKENGEMVLTERQILEKFYIEAGGANWKSSENWLSDRLPICSWHGINCTTIDGSPHVTGIQLEGNQLSGVISSYIFLIPHLKVLNLNSNDIIVSFGYAAQPCVLEELNLSNTLITNITGIGTLGNLTVLNVADSYLFDLPREVFLLEKLVELDISHNDLRGTLPSEIGNLSNLVSLRAYGNSFSGQIPSSIGRLVKLIHLDLGKLFNLFMIDPLRL